MLFIGHLAVICWVAFTKGLKLLKADASNTENGTEVGEQIYCVHGYLLTCSHHFPEVIVSPL